MTHYPKAYNSAFKSAGHAMTDAAQSGKPTPSKQSGLKGPWKPGQSGNPAGRPKGARNKLGEAFVADLYADWQENGIAAIKEVRETKPEAYLKVVAQILPKIIQVEDLRDLTDEQLDQQLRHFAGFLAEHIGSEGGISEVAPGTEAPTGPH